MIAIVPTSGQMSIAVASQPVVTVSKIAPRAIGNRTPARKIAIKSVITLLASTILCLTPLTLLL